MKRLRFKHRRLAIVGGAIVVAFLILILALWLPGLPWGRWVPQDGAYHYRQATIVIDSVEKTGRYTTSPANPIYPTFEFTVTNGYFPILTLTVASTGDCSLLLEPALYTTGQGLVWTEGPGGSLKTEVELAPGESETIRWVFYEVNSGDDPKELRIKVSDRTGQADPDEVTFRFKKPNPFTSSPEVPTTTGL